MCVSPDLSHTHLIISLTFSHDIIKELHDGDASVRVVMEQLGIHSGGEEQSEEEEESY